MYHQDLLEDTNKRIVRKKKKKKGKEIPVQCFVILFMGRLSLGAINNKSVCLSPKYVWIFTQNVPASINAKLCLLLLLLQILFHISIK